MNFSEKLDKIVKKNNSLLCIGLDPEIEKIPASLRAKKSPLFAFNRYIVDATHDLVCAYKPNMAFYEALGLNGLLQLLIFGKLMQSPSIHFLGWTPSLLF